jgi:hypothetical protein
MRDCVDNSLLSKLGDVNDELQAALLMSILEYIMPRPIAVPVHRQGII